MGDKEITVEEIHRAQDAILVYIAGCIDSWAALVKDPKKVDNVSKQMQGLSNILRKSSGVTLVKDCNAD